MCRLCSQKADSLCVFHQDLTFPFVRLFYHWFCDSRSFFSLLVSDILENAALLTCSSLCVSVLTFQPSFSRMAVIHLQNKHSKRWFEGCGIEWIFSFLSVLQPKNTLQYTTPLGECKNSCNHGPLSMATDLWLAARAHRFLKRKKKSFASTSSSVTVEQCYLAATLPTMQLCYWVASLEVIYQIQSSFLWSHKRLHTTVVKIFKHNKCVKAVELPFNDLPSALSFSHDGWIG